MATPPVAANPIPGAFPEEVWDEAGKLPCLLTIDLPLRRFAVRDLLSLECGDILESQNANGGHVPVTVNARLIGWAEFEVVGQRMAVRMTELA
jgi:flagellar motor switch/type III secretory pathway protein FliN